MAKITAQDKANILAQVHHRASHKAAVIRHSQEIDQAEHQLDQDLLNLES